MERTLDGAIVFEEKNMVKNVLGIKTEGRKRITIVMDVPALSESMKNPKNRTGSLYNAVERITKLLDSGIHFDDHR